MAFNLYRKGEPKYLFVHHTATPAKTTTVQAIMDGSLWFAENPSYAAELKRQGYRCDYNILITPDGKAHLTQPLNMNCHHAYHDEYNNNSISLCIVGNLDIEQPTSEQMSTITRLAIWFRQQYPNIKHKKHSDVVNTGCPGRNFKWEEYLKMIEKKTILLRIKDPVATVNGVRQELPIYPFIVQDNGGHTVIPLRFIAEALGASVSWDANLKAIKIER